MGKLVAVLGDQNDHGGGDLLASNNPGKMFVQGKKVVMIDSTALPDAIPHDVPLVNAATGATKLFVCGIAVHRHDDTRYCGAKTIVTNQSKLTCL